MLDLDLFLREDLMAAPKHPLEENLELPLPNSQQATVTEIHALQLRYAIPGVVKRMIPFDSTTFWEYWWCVPDRLLLPSDVQLLKSDRPRIEAILSKLVWLWGGYCFGEETCRDRDCESVNDWQEVIAFAQQHGFKPDVIDIDFLPLAVKLDNGHSDLKPEPATSNYVAVEPNHWHVEFFQLQPTNGGFKLQEPKSVCSCQIWTRPPFMKHLGTGEVINRYDLWVSSPLDITNPPWRSSPASDRE